MPTLFLFLGALLAVAKVTGYLALSWTFIACVSLLPLVVVLAFLSVLGFLWGVLLGVVALLSRSSRPRRR
jgi:hypothetical protein